MQKLILLFFLISFMAMAQNPREEDIVGSYRLLSSDPQGGQWVTIFENKTFATFYFGGALKGTWKIEGNQVKFKTTAHPKFYLYGCKLESLIDSTHLNFSCEESSLVNLNSKTSDTFQPLFNQDANCFDYPYILKIAKQFSEVAFAKIAYGQNGEGLELYKFKIPKDFNDLVVVGLSNQYTEVIEFTATYKNGNLYFDSNKKAATKRPASIEDSEDEKSYMDEFMKKELIPELLAYGNEFFPRHDNPTDEQLAPFTRITPIKIEKGNIKIGKNNLFTAICN